jgi:hypothetical protein
MFVRVWVRGLLLVRFHTSTCRLLLSGAGTPISHGGKSDLLGLLKFLQVPHIPTGEGTDF